MKLLRVWRDTHPVEEVYQKVREPLTEFPRCLSCLPGKVEAKDEPEDRRRPQNTSQ